ncbi:hypothetical protein VR010_05240 [Actinomycetaceae bacterium L2_0104]
MKILIVVVVIALLAVYLVLSVRRLWRSVRSAMAIGGELGGKMAEPFSKYPPLPADPPLASPFESERREAARKDRQRVRDERGRLRTARLRRATLRWSVIDPNVHPYAHLDRRQAKEAWTARQALRHERAHTNT